MAVTRVVCVHPHDVHPYKRRKKENATHPQKSKSLEIRIALLSNAQFTVQHAPTKNVFTVWPNGEFLHVAFRFRQLLFPIKWITYAFN